MKRFVALEAVMWAFVALLLTVFSPVIAHGQTPTVDPNWVEFDIVPDQHPNIARYELGWFIPGATDPVQTASLGTAAPTGTLVRLALPQSYPVGRVYVARVRAVTLDGTFTLTGVWSNISNPFGKGPSQTGDPRVVK